MELVMTNYGDSAPIYKLTSTRNNSIDYDNEKKLNLYQALNKDECTWEDVKKVLDQYPHLLTATLSKGRDTPLHIAALVGKEKIVEELVKMIPSQDLEEKNENGDTALAIAAAGGKKKIAEFMVIKNRNLIRIRNRDDHIPVVIASRNDNNKEMIQYLYVLTPIEEFNPDQIRNNNGATLLTNCILAEIFDIALDLLRWCPKLAIAPDFDNDTAINVLAQKPSAFPSGTELRFWQRWIYNCIPSQQPHALSNIQKDIERPYEELNARKNLMAQELDQLHIHRLFWVKLLKSFAPEIFEKKLKHFLANELLYCICRVISTQDESQFKRIGVEEAVLNATRHGIVEFIDMITICHPDIVRSFDQVIFFYATVERQEKIFNLINKLGARKNLIATSSNNGASMLSEAAKLAPSYQLDRVAGAALQMQRELQWFKAVEKIVQPKSKATNYKEGQTPRDLFSEKHKDLVEEAKKWLTDTSTSSSVVAALIATIMFSAAFSVPGGYTDTGNPLYLHRNSFMVFVISDALSLFSSSTSVLMFLGILTSRYKEDDFLKSLPTKLIIGLSLLFFSIATMMITFGTVLVILLRDRHLTWIPIPIILMGSIPVTIFAFLQFPLLLEMIISTYGPGIFKSRKN